MPLPESAISSTANRPPWWPPAAASSCLVWITTVPPSGMASQAFCSTEASVVRRPSGSIVTGSGFSARTRTTLTLRGTLLRIKGHEVSIMASRSREGSPVDTTARCADSVSRREISAARRVASLARWIRPLRSPASSSSSTRSRLPMAMFSRLLNSCAMPPVSVATARDTSSSRRLRSASMRSRISSTPTQTMRPWMPGAARHTRRSGSRLPSAAIATTSNGSGRPVLERMPSTRSQRSEDSASR